MACVSCSRVPVGPFVFVVKHIFIEPRGVLVHFNQNSINPSIKIYIAPHKDPYPTQRRICTVFFPLFMRPIQSTPLPIVQQGILCC